MTLDELEALEKAATPGEWHASGAPYSAYDDDHERLCRHHHEECVYTVSRSVSSPGWCTDGGHPHYGICEHDAKLIAAARNALPKLLALARAVAPIFDCALVEGTRDTQGFILECDVQAIRDALAALEEP